MAKAKKLKSGSYRCLVYDYTDGTGKRHYESFTADTRREAERTRHRIRGNQRDKETPG